MEIERSQLVEAFLERGELCLAEQAERDLPKRIDPLLHGDALRALGIDPGLLLTQADNLEA